MADAPTERRKFSRRRLKLSCHLLLSSGTLVHGTTHEISLQGVTVDAQPLPRRQQNRTPKTGDLVLLTLEYHNQGVPGSLKSRCRVMHTQASRIGLHLFYSKMSKRDKQTLDMILETESGKS